jgi:hypothetical protein
MEGTLRLYEPAARESGRPCITNPTHLWIRLAYAWLLASTALHAQLGIREGLGGLPEGPALARPAPERPLAAAEPSCCDACKRESDAFTRASGGARVPRR